jgi:hypothetical protein
VAEVMMLKKLVTGIPVGEVQIRVSAETAPLLICVIRNREKSGQRKQDRPWTVSFSSLRDRADFYLKKMLCDRLVKHKW